jgi:hypothetical protein
VHKADRGCIFHRLRNGNDDGLCAFTPQIINDDVDSVSKTSAQCLLVVFRALRMIGSQTERDNDVCAQRQQILQLCFIAACSDHLAGAKISCQLDGEPACGPCCAIDEDRFSGLDLRSLSSPQYDIAERNAKLDPEEFPLLRQSGAILFDRFDRRYKEGLDLILRGPKPRTVKG